MILVVNLTPEQIREFDRKRQAEEDEQRNPKAPQWATSLEKGKKAPR